jgi:hypothetical protein
MPRSLSTRHSASWRSGSSPTYDGSTTFTATTDPVKSAWSVPSLTRVMRLRCTWKE